MCLVSRGTLESLLSSGRSALSSPRALENTHTCTVYIHVCIQRKERPFRNIVESIDAQGADGYYRPRKELATKQADDALAMWVWKLSERNAAVTGNEFRSGSDFSDSAERKQRSVHSPGKIHTGIYSHSP